MPYFTCRRCRLTYYTAAGWAYAPECPRCYEPAPRPRPTLAIPISRRLRQDGRRAASKDRDD